MQNIEIASPLKGEWAIFNPPGHPKLAFDFLAVNSDKSPYRKFSFTRHLISFITVEDTFTWSMPIYSPASGEVIESYDGEPDRKRICFLYDLFRLLLNKPKESGGFGPFGGNHIMIQNGEFFILLCHLKEGSILVKKGDKVTEGQEIAAVGNSGSSIQPHLHIQVMKDNHYFPLFGNLLPFKFKHGEIKVDGKCEQKRPVILTNGGHYIFE